ncbi:MAG: methionine biosynthesis protein MetW [Desulfobacteraceae bacterium]|jgi:methionine biosynthesis protein MetW
MPTPNNILLQKPLRYDLRIAASLIDPGTKVLGLGCGEGDLLYYLKHQKQVICTGIERNEAKVSVCIQRGLSVLQGDINTEVEDYPDNAFDYIVLSQTLQEIYSPEKLIDSMLRIGKKCVVSFPNFSHWRNRLQLMFKGIAPVSCQLPYEWNDTPNIRVITIKDFRQFVKKMGLTIYKEVAINTQSQNKEGNIVGVLPNLWATYGLYLIGKK